MFISEDDERNRCSSQAKAKRKGISRTQMALAVEHRYRTLRLCGKRIPFHLCHFETSPKRYVQCENWTLFPDFKSSAPTNRSQRIMTFQATNLAAVKGFASLWWKPGCQHLLDYHLLASLIPNRKSCHQQNWKKRKKWYFSSILTPDKWKA